MCRIESIIKGCIAVSDRKQRYILFWFLYVLVSQYIDRVLIVYFSDGINHTQSNDRKHTQRRNDKMIPRDIERHLITAVGYRVPYKISRNEGNREREQKTFHAV